MKRSELILSVDRVICVEIGKLDGDLTAEFSPTVLNRVEGALSANGIRRGLLVSSELV